MLQLLSIASHPRRAWFYLHSLCSAEAISPLEAEQPQFPSASPWAPCAPGRDHCGGPHILLGAGSSRLSLLSNSTTT